MADPVIKPGYVLQNYRFEEVLGRYDNLRVWRATNTLINRSVVIKVYNRSKLLTNTDKTTFVLEKSSLKSMDHPFLPLLLDCIETKTDSFLIREYVGAVHLQDIITKYGVIEVHRIQKFFQQIVLTVEYLHKNNFIIFDDYDYNSIMIDDNDNIRIVDFKLLKEGSLPTYHEDLSPEKMTDERMNFIPPEVLKGEKYTPLSDIWVLGVTLFYMSFGHLPFRENVQKNILNGNPIFPTVADRNLVDLIRKMLRKDPVNRPTLQQIKMHAWFPKNNIEDILLHRKMFSQEIDHEVLAKLNRLGDISCISNQIAAGETGGLVSAYRTLLREKTTEEISKMIRCAKEERKAVMDVKTFSNTLAINRPIIRLSTRSAPARVLA